VSFGFAKIAGGAPSSVGGLTNHLQNLTLTVEEYRLASYYGAGGLSPEDLRLAASAELVADGTLSYSEALDGLVQEWLQQPTSDPVDLPRQL
jgi:hypothetical protein